jgi:hypothetical protein
MPKKPDPVVRAVRMDAGQLRLSDGTERGEALARRLLAGALKHLPDGPYELEVRPFEQTRRARANAYLWAVVYKLIAAESGYTPDQVHELMKVRHNHRLMVDPETGEEIRVGQTTTKLSVEAFGHYIERVMVDGAEWWGVSFPEPRASEEYRDKRRAA